MFARSANPIWFFNDLTGNPLNDTDYAFFLTNTLPYIPQPVYQDPNGINAWADPLEFGPNGGLPQNLYFNPDLVYRIEIRSGPTQNDALLYLIENYVPDNGGSSPSGTSFAGSQNLIIDPNFSDISFSSPVTFTTQGTYNIAPGWQLILTGAGSSTLTQFPIAADSGLAGNPPFALEILSSGWTSAQLVQTFTNNGAIFANGGSIAMSMLAKTALYPFSPVLSYLQNGSLIGSVPNPPVPTAVGVYTTIGGIISPVPPSINSVSGSAGYTQMTISLPTNDTIYITNVQFVGQSSPISASTSLPPYQEQSYAQIVNQEFYIYRDSILNHPKNSILTGWNFGNNPWQFAPPVSQSVAANQYTADQTIVIQQNYVAGPVGNNIAVGRASVANNYGYQATAVTAHNQFAILQWIDAASIRQYWGQIMSSMVKAFLSTTHSTSVRIKARLIWKATLPTNPATQTDPISSWTEGSDPVAAAGYTLIAPQNDPSYLLTSTPTEYSFNGFVLPASSNANMTLGILIYTVGNMSQTATADSVTFNDVSLVQNLYALPTQPETYDETLKKCQYYYEMSYENFASVGVASTLSSQLIFPQVAITSGGTTVMYGNAFTIPFKVPKRISPTVTLYSPATGASANVHAAAYSSSSSVYGDSAGADYAATNYSSAGGLNYYGYNIVLGAAAGPNTTHVTAPQAAIISLQYTADSRI